MKFGLGRRHLALAAAGLAAAAPARAAFPERPVRLIVPFTPGGTVDLVGRLVATKFSQNNAQSMVVENRGGASGEIGSVAAVRSPADGYTLLVGSTSTISIVPQVNPAAQYDPVRDLTPVCFVGYAPMSLVVNPAIPVRSVAELVALMKARPRPLSFGDGGPGTPHHMAGERFRCSTGTELVHVPYRGGGAVHADLVAGHIDAAFIELSVSSPYIRDGQYGAIGVAARERHVGFPDLPTLIEQGVPDFEIISWYGIFAPAGTPEPVVAWLSGEVRRALTDPETRDKMVVAGITVVASTPAGLAEHVARDRARWAGLISLSCN